MATPPGPEASQAPAGFLAAPATSDAVQALYDEDREDVGYVMNLSRLWAHQPAAQESLFDLMGQVVRDGSLTFRERAVLVAACASTIGDSYCSLAWGSKLAGVAGADVAASVLRGDDVGLVGAERELAAWARKVAASPNDIRPEDVDALRTAGYDDAQIFAITTFVALRLAFSTVNDALGARPDIELVRSVEAPVRDAVTFGRPAAGGASTA